MARAHLFRSIADNQGNLLFNATVTVYEADFAVPLGQTIFLDDTSADSFDNPFICLNGIVDFWLDTPQRLCLLIQQPTVPDMVVYADVNPAADQIVYSDNGIQITNAPTSPGQVLLSTGADQVAQWGDAPTGTGLTPIVTVVNDDFSSGGDPLGWTFSGAQVGTRTYDPGNIPSGTNYLYSLKFAGPTSILKTNSFTFLESGTAKFWLETTLTASQTVLVELLDVSNSPTTVLTITNSRGWGYYSIPIATGTWSLRITYSGTAGSPNAMWLTGFLAQYGGSVPTHNHQGAGSNSVALGVSATAVTGATAIGANASATGTNSSSIGYGSSASGSTAFAAGNGASASANYAIAIGSGAAGSNTNTAWIAIGQSAAATGLESLAVGKSAQATGDEGVAIGSSASATGTGAVAIGQASSSAATDGFALGVGATVAVGHTNSVALGAGAATTASNQVMLGNANTVAVVAGSLTTTGQVAVGGSSSKVGFYGSAGRTKPVVNGSDNGNIVVRNLIQGLAAMGLVTNNTVQQPAAFAVPVGNIDYFLRAQGATNDLGVSDFDFQPYLYAPAAYGGPAPFATNPNWSINITHTAQKSTQVGPAALKNAYNPNASFTVQVQTITPGSLVSGDAFALVARHTGATDGSASSAYLVFDSASSSVSLGINNGNGVPTSYTVGGGNSVSLTTAGGNVFDGSLHTITVISGYQSLGVQIDSSKPYFFKDTSVNLTGTYIGFDTNVSVVGNIVFSALLFNPTANFDGFNTTVAATTTLGNNDSGRAWNMVTAVGSSTVATGSGVATLTAQAGAGNHIGCYVTTVLNTMGKTIRSTMTSVPGSGTGGILVHFTDINNYVLVTATLVIQVLAGVQTTIATHSSAIVANDLITINVTAAGLVTVFKNASQVSSVTPTVTIPQNPNMGLYVANAAVMGVGFFLVTDQFNATVYK